LTKATGTRIGDAYDAGKEAVKAKTAAAYDYGKEKASQAVDAVKAKAEPVAANFKKTGEAWGMASGAKTKAQVLLGPLSGLLSGDLFGDQMPYSFVGQKHAVVDVIGMAATFDDTKDMRDGIRKVFGVTDSAMIYNETGFLPGKTSIVNDIIQSVLYETLGVVDAPAINTALALKEGIKEKGEVFAVVHSQGSEVFREAVKLLTPEERSHVHYQGFGSETYIDAKELGLAEARNVINRGDLIPKVANAAKVPAAALQMDPTANMATRITGVMVNINGQKWEVVDAPANTKAFREAGNPYVTEKQYNSTNNHHLFLKYYIPFLKAPRGDE